MRLLSKAPGETAAFGHKLGSLLKAGDTVCLYGDLGAGKTTFVKGIASALGIPEREITSASFTIVAEHRGKRRGAELPFYHIDLYRLGDKAHPDSIGLEEYLGKRGVSVIEWAERLENDGCSVSVVFGTITEDEREIIIKGINEEAWNNL